MLISVKLLKKCIIIIYALGLVHGKKFSFWIKVIPKSIEILGRARREEWLSHSKLKQVFLFDSDADRFVYLIPVHALYEVQLMKSLASELAWALHYSDWPFDNLVLTTCALTLKMTNAQVAETSINSTTVLFRTRLWTRMIIFHLLTCMKWLQGSNHSLQENIINILWLFKQS